MDPLTPAELRGRRVLVLGLGAFGGGAGCARALAKLGAQVTVSDLRGAGQLTESVASLEGLDVSLALGGHHEGLFRDAQVVVVNPAVPSEARWLQVARDEGCQLTTEVNLALAACPEVPALAVTGTHGKSTCAAFAAHLLGALPGRTVLAGNLGGSLLEQTEGLGVDDRLVVELSSFQTERLLAPPGWPRIAALTCLGSDHLDRHHTVPEYWGAKRRLLAFQDARGVLLLPGMTDDAAASGATATRPEREAEYQRWAAEARGEVRRMDGAALAALGLDTADLPSPEPFLLPSYLAALHSAAELGVSPEQLRTRARTFPGLPHRLQPIPGPDGVRVLDNGVATHPEPTEAALRHTSGDLVLLLGGKDKGLPLDALAEAARRCVRIHAYGQGGRRFAECCAERGIAVTCSDGIRAATRNALEKARIGETILFSPSFSSYDEFRNFRDRAELFRALCHEAAPRPEAGDERPSAD